MSISDLLSETLTNARHSLLAERNAAGHWEGELSTSALSTATAVVALHTVDPEAHRSLIQGGLRWLIDHQNEDGGWGDTVLSFSNISTTLLCWAALNLAPQTELLPGPTEAVARAEKWIHGYVGSLEPGAIAEKVKDRYGKDRTFSVPILMCCAIAGRLGTDPKAAWRRVLPLPFELAAFPRKMFAILRLPVVSYALPALISIGYARFYHAPPSSPWRWLRRRAWPKTSRLLETIQPSSGGFLEAAPLTSFVTMALASSGQKSHPVVARAVRFLGDSVRPDGSWPIDTNLATWGTTLAVKALMAQDRPRTFFKDTPNPEDFSERDRAGVRDWLLGQQYTEIHPYTDAPPGGWAWTDLPGGVPDADDTPGALLALRQLADEDTFGRCRDAAVQGIHWLLGLQNTNGGIPTFCRGWGALPFDRSSPDLTAHTLRAWNAWLPHVDPILRARIGLAKDKALAYLAQTQQADGSWVPLWFGNQHLPDETNPTYGTAMVLLALSQLDANDLIGKALHWLLTNQRDDGGWGSGKGTPASIEETALALNALAALAGVGLVAHDDPAIQNGARYLAEATKNGTQFPPSPIGFYFAKLWYFEKLYPMVWTVSALTRLRELSASS